MKFNKEKVQRDNRECKKSQKFNNIYNAKNPHNRLAKQDSGVLNCCSFKKHYRNHAHNPTGKFPVKAKSVQKSMTNNSTQQSGNTHGKKVNLKKDKCFFLFG